MSVDPSKIMTGPLIGVPSSIHAVCSDGGRLIGGEIWRNISAKCPVCAQTDARIEALEMDEMLIVCTRCGHEWRQ